MMVIRATLALVLLSLPLPRGSEASAGGDVQPMPPSCVQYCHKAAGQGQKFDEEFSVFCSHLTADPDKECGRDCPECPGAPQNSHCHVEEAGGPGGPKVSSLKCRLDASFMKEPKCLAFCQEQAQQKGKNMTAFQASCGWDDRKDNACATKCPEECHQHCDWRKHMECPALPISPPAPTTTPKGEEGGGKLDDNTQAAIVVAVVTITGLVLLAGAVWFLKFRKDGTVAPAA